MNTSLLTLTICAAALGASEVKASDKAAIGMSGMTMPAHVKAPVIRPPTVTSAIKALKLMQGWISAAPPGAEEISAYVVLSNPEKVALTLTGVSTPAAGSVMLMTTTRDAAGREGMQMVSSLKIPAGGTLTVLPGRAHLMLRAFRRQPQPGDSVTVTLRFSDGSSRTISLPVRKLP